MPKQPTPDEEAQQRAAAMREIEESNRERDSARRAMFTAFRMWTLCPDKRCIRRRACVGDVERCVMERWQPIIPPRVKALIGKILARVQDGMSMAEAIADAQAEMARHSAALERDAAMQAETAIRRRAPAPAMSDRKHEAPPARPVRAHGPRIS